MLNLRSVLARRKEWLAQLRLRRGFERAFKAMLVVEFEREGKESAADYRAGRAYNAQDHRSGLQTIFFAFYVTIMATFSKRLTRALTPIKSESLVLAGPGSYPVEYGTLQLDFLEKDTEEQITLRMRNFARKWAAQHVQRVSQTTEKRINRAISKGIAESKTRDEIADDIYETTGSSVGEFRAEVIARTETHTASQAGSLETAKALGIPLKKAWVATQDDRTRGDHRDVDTEPILMDDTFQVGNDELQFPGDPEGSPEEIINCRCVLVYESISSEPSETP